MFSDQYEDLVDLHNGLTKRVALATEDKISYVTSQDVQLHDVTVSANSCKMEYDLKDYWLTSSRWTMLIRQYIDPAALDAWLNLIEQKMKGGKRGQAFLRTKTVDPRGSKRVSRQWGSCIIGFGFRAAPHPKLIMHSRTSFLGYIAVLDLNIAATLARIIGDRLGYEDMGFIWHLDSAQFHYARSLAWWFTLDRPFLEMDPQKVKHRPGLHRSILRLQEYKQEDEDGVRYGDRNFASAIRPRKRWHTEVLGYDYAQQYEGGELLNASSRKAFKPLPSVMSSTLDFSKLKDEGDPDNADYMDECCCCS